MLRALMPTKKGADRNRKEKELLTLELAEIKEVSDLLFQKIEKKVRVLEALEASVDKKIMELELLVQRADALRPAGSESAIGRHDIAALARKGMKSNEIATLLGMPVGEVELLLNLNAYRT
jgi:hypothetical protein